MNILTRLATKSLEVCVALLVISVCAFALVRAVPGDPVSLMMGERGSDAEQYAQVRARMGLDKPLIQQYRMFVQSATRGDLGTSLRTQRPVIEEFMDRWPATLELGMVAMGFALIVGVALGTLAAVKRGSVWDHACSLVSLVGYATPSFWLSMVLIFVFSVGLGWTPVSGRIDVLYDIPARTGTLSLDALHPEVLREYGMGAWLTALKHMVLPAAALALMPLAVIAKTTRASMLDVLTRDYLRSARARGIGRLTVLLRHGLRNALVPVVTVAGALFVSSLVTDALLIETIFSWPGVGSYIVSSLHARDYPVVQGSILLMGTAVLLLNGLTQLVNSRVNPRMRAR